MTPKDHVFTPGKQPVEQLNQWNIADSGLSTRIINCARSVRLTTVDQLRALTDEQLRRIKHFGPRSLRELREFLELLDSISEEECHFQSIQYVFDRFLDENQFLVLSCRYGLDEKIDTISRKRMTLQQIANRSGRTRERVRQIEREARKALSSRGATLCLEPFYRFFTDTLKKKLEGSANLSQLLLASDRKACNNYHPASLMLLLYDLDSTSFTFYDNFFSILSHEQLQRLQNQSISLLQQPATPLMTARGLVTALRNNDIHAPFAARAIDLLMHHSPVVCNTADDKHFHFESGCASFLTSLFSQPKHYREITRLFNDRVMTHCRKGSGTILRILTTSPIFSPAGPSGFHVPTKPFFPECKSNEKTLTTTGPCPHEHSNC